MKNEILNLMKEVTVEEMHEMEGKGGFSKAQCAWMYTSCVNYIPGAGTGWGCGGYDMCNEWRTYCK
ncbi:hypothetical protein CON70_27490 [Bacillus pseudomycoides]|uniref:sublancin family glycopeptide n=1 Tax=Bacillus pseudomycoides TaxID=64104 RepID=UPI000BEB760B|nr:sublancin family glycopeptide [Bacillus pseudomycoides]PDZ08481.1 hypothetical protein CON70_27490 [Bacillus pseudomycoides]